MTKIFKNYLKRSSFAKKFAKICDIKKLKNYSIAKKNCLHLSIKPLSNFSGP